MVHHALCNIIEPIFERRFIDDSYASRTGKGIHAALDRCQTLMQRFPYVLRCDIVQFFPSVDLTILRRILAREIADRDIVRLCDLILHGRTTVPTMGYVPHRFPGDTAASMTLRPHGLPIGNQTSQFWANCYLDRLDHFVKDDLGCRGYIRYVDDMVLFGATKPQLHAWRAAIIAFLATQLRLCLHEPESAVTPVMTGVPYLGFRVFPTHRRLRRRNGVAFAHRLRGMASAYQRGELAQDEITRRVQGWVAHVAHGDTYRLRAALFAGVTLRQDEEPS